MERGRESEGQSKHARSQPAISASDLRQGTQGWQRPPSVVEGRGPAAAAPDLRSSAPRGRRRLTAWRSARWRRASPSGTPSSAVQSAATIRPSRRRPPRPAPRPGQREREGRRAVRASARRCGVTGSDGVQRRARRAAHLKLSVDGRGDRAQGGVHRCRVWVGGHGSSEWWAQATSPQPQRRSPTNVGAFARCPAQVEDASNFAPRSAGSQILAVCRSTKSGRSPGPDSRPAARPCCAAPSRAQYLRGTFAIQRAGTA